MGCIKRNLYVTSVKFGEAGSRVIPSQATKFFVEGVET